MLEYNSKEARQHWSELLDRVEKGEEIKIIRRGKTIARLTPEMQPLKKMSNLKKFRESLKEKVGGVPLSQVVIKMRREARY